MQPGHHQWISTAITLVIVAVVVAIRSRSIGRDRPLRLERLWVVPAIYGTGAMVAFWFLPPHGLAWLWCAAMFALGAALGWYRGKMVAIAVDPDTHALNQRTSPAAMLFILAIVLIRVGTRIIAVEMGVGSEMLLLITDLLIAFALGFLPVQRLEMGLRAARLLRRARSLRGEIPA